VVGNSLRERFETKFPLLHQAGDELCRVEELHPLRVVVVVPRMAAGWAIEDDSLNPQTAHLDKVMFTHRLGLFWHTGNHHRKATASLILTQQGNIYPRPEEETEEGLRDFRDGGREGRDTADIVKHPGPILLEKVGREVIHEVRPEEALFVRIAEDIMFFILVLFNKVKVLRAFPGGDDLIPDGHHDLSCLDPDGTDLGTPGTEGATVDATGIGIVEKTIGGLGIGEERWEKGDWECSMLQSPCSSFFKHPLHRYPLILQNIIRIADPETFTTLGTGVKLNFPETASGGDGRIST
jgi:hypothetical protein